MEHNKNSKKIVYVCLIFVIVIMMISGVFVYINLIQDKNDEPESNASVEEKEELKESDEDKTESVDEVINLTAEEKEKYNMQITDGIAYSLRKMLDFQTMDIEFNKNYLDDVQNKITFIWELVVVDETINKKLDYNINGIEETGAIAVEINGFKNRYKQVFGEDVLESAINEHLTLEIKDGYIYGSYVTGWGWPEFVLKVKSYLMDQEKQIYEFTFDFLTVYETFESNGKIYKQFDDEMIELYIEPDVLEYPQNIVYAQMKLELKKAEDEYIIQSIKFEK